LNDGPQIYAPSPTYTFSITTGSTGLSL
jgi:hypothetical protein